MWVKICGITQVDQALAIAALGATDLGFICVPQSPRYLSPEALAPILQALRDRQVRVGTVGVFADADLATIGPIVNRAGLSTVQLHGGETPQTCQRLRQGLAGVRLIKAIRVRTQADLSRALTYTPWVDALLLDAYHPDSLGGTGHTLDWAALSQFRPPCPWFLAGGLRPDNIQTALASLSPDGIDLSSGVEQRPGWKDLTLVAELFQALSPNLPPSPEP
ncbi:MAG: phosphoribosylanthranilate isomerase [Cyanobacteriota bacterium]|nr:phosphoribosylanthranilate isomerase [Cyanobacteriota bacterium]